MWSIPMQDDNPYLPPKVDYAAIPAGDACIRVTRSTSYMDFLLVYRILLDGHEVARISAGQTVDVPVASGRHSIVAKVNGAGSPTRHFRIAARKTVQFECGSNLRGLRIFLTMVYLLFLRDEWLTLDQV
ncbi:MAG: hypothetical protein GY758_11505 [Fuerstiella sp.]|nr:hypothetical protein [Fuerstiella sp.]